MRLLLDTHIFLWAIQGETKLSKSTRSKIIDATEVYVSSVSIWELAIKIQLKKLSVNLDELICAIGDSGFLELPFTFEHARKIETLPPIHRDPFDRALIAQALSEPLTLLTCDEILKKYSHLVEIIN